MVALEHIQDNSRRKLSADTLRRNTRKVYRRNWRNNAKKDETKKRTPENIVWSDTDFISLMDISSNDDDKLLVFGV
jgi:hypothetical protein